MLRTILKLWLSLLVLCLSINSQAQFLRKTNYLQLGKIELSQGHFTQAIEEFNFAINLNPYLYEAYSLRAFAKNQLDDFVGAEYVMLLLSRAATGIKTIIACAPIQSPHFIMP